MVAEVSAQYTSTAIADNSVSIPAPFDSVQARLDDGSDTYDSRHAGSLADWVGSIMSRIEVD